MYCLRETGLVLVLALGMVSVSKAQTSTMLLEKGIYTEETLGNLTEAIKIYKQIVADADAGRPTAALALFRLGKCYQKNGQKEEAQATFVKLARSYPEQKDLLSKIPASTSGELKLVTAPWVDGEVLQFALKTKGGLSTGVQVYRVQATQANAKKAWKLESIFSPISISQYSSATVDVATLIPMNSRQKFPHTLDIRAEYISGKAELSIVRGGTSTNQQVPVGEVVYDYDQIYQIIRCLPLSQGFHATIPTFTVMGGRRADLKVEVVARERVTVPAGTFDCYKIVLTPENATLFQTVWFSADSHVYPVKSDRGSLETELESVKTPEKNRPVYFEDVELAISMSAPNDWIITRLTLPEGRDVVHIIGPETKVEGLVVVRGLSKSESESPSMGKTVDQLIEEKAKSVKGYAVRPGSRETVNISGHAAERYIADLKNILTGQDMTEFVLILLTQRKRYVLSFQADRDGFDSVMSDFDPIIRTLRVE